MRVGEGLVPECHYLKGDILHLYILISYVTGILLSPLYILLSMGVSASFSLVLFSKHISMTLVLIISNYLQESDKSMTP